MAKYDIFHQPTALKLGDTFQFLTGDGPVNYKSIHGNHITNDVECDNSAIFDAFGLDKKEFCTKAYGYEAGYGDCPTCGADDDAAILRLVLALFAVQAAKGWFPKEAAKPVYNVGDRVVPTLARADRFRSEKNSHKNEVGVVEKLQYEAEFADPRAQCYVIRWPGGCCSHFGAIDMDPAPIKVGDYIKGAGWGSGAPIEGEVIGIDHDGDYKLRDGRLIRKAGAVFCEKPQSPLNEDEEAIVAAVMTGDWGCRQASVVALVEALRPSLKGLIK